MTGPLYKTTIVIWSEYNPRDSEIYDLARDAVDGDAYCSRVTETRVEDPAADSDWDGTEFFENTESVDDSQLGLPTMGDHEDEQRREAIYGRKENNR